MHPYLCPEEHRYGGSTQLSISEVNGLRGEEIAGAIRSPRGGQYQWWSGRVECDVTFCLVIVSINNFRLGYDGRCCFCNSDELLSESVLTKATNWSLSKLWFVIDYACMYLKMLTFSTAKSYTSPVFVRHHPQGRGRRRIFSAYHPSYVVYKDPTFLAFNGCTLTVVRTNTMSSLLKYTEPRSTRKHRVQAALPVCVCACIHVSGLRAAFSFVGE